MNKKSLILFLSALGLALPVSPLGAQSMGKRTVNLNLQASYRMPKELLRIPLNSAGVHPVLKDRWEHVAEKASKKKKKSKDKNAIPDLPWGIHILGFDVEKLETPTTPGSQGKTEPVKEPAKPANGAQPKSSRQPTRRFTVFRNFDDYIKKTSRGYKWSVKDEPRKQSSGRRLPYRFFSWDKAKGQQKFLCAVYKNQGREVALVGYYFDVPLKLPKKAQKAYDKRTLETRRAVEKGIESLIWERGRQYKEQGVLGEHRYATTDLRKKILEGEKKSIAGYADWDIFCTKDFIIKYSFDQGKGKKSDAYRFANRMARQMGDMILQYQKYFPPHDKMTKWWSVLRICRNHSEFSKYGSTRAGVIGWFNPLSKELVIFRSKRYSEAVAYHEGWHQYAHFWYGGMARLHRWYDEGLGDFFGAMARKSNHRFDLQSSRMRLATIKKLVKDGKTVPLKDIVRWNKKRFYGPKAGLYYAQGWAIVDFLMRGEGSEHWKPGYRKVMDTYTQVCLETKDQTKAVEAAFQGFDWVQFEKDWKAYVRDLE